MTHHIACRLNAVVLRTARLNFQRSQSTILVGDVLRRNVSLQRLIYLSPIVGDNVLLTVCVFMCLCLGLLAEKNQKVLGADFDGRSIMRLGLIDWIMRIAQRGRVHTGPNIVRFCTLIHTFWQTPIIWCGSSSVGRGVCLWGQLSSPHSPYHGVRAGCFVVVGMRFNHRQH